MKTRVVILAGGEGSRLSVLTAKRAKPAVPFAGKYRIIDFALSNCTNSGLFDVMLMAQYRPQSLIEHIGAGGPWDLNRDFTGGVRIYTPYKARFGTDWFVGTADAVQQNFSFIKRERPDHILVLSGDHIYAMDYDALITFHIDHQADLTMATFRVPEDESSRYGIVGVDENYRVTSFIEKPKNPRSTLANMGVYVFNLDILDQALWADRNQHDSSHDFGKNILPRLVSEGRRVFAYPYTGYWVDVGTIESYWQAQMDLLVPDPPLNLNDRRWVIHTRTEERPPVWIERDGLVVNSMLSDGCIIEKEAQVENSILSPGVVVHSGAVVRESIVMTDCQIGQGARLERAILDKRVQVGENSTVGGLPESALDAGEETLSLVLIGKNSKLPPGIKVLPGAIIGTDVVFSDFDKLVVDADSFIQTKRQPYEVSD
jgi:glucose-1-phosphate adenylyltransferase